MQRPKNQIPFAVRGNGNTPSLPPHTWIEFMLIMLVAGFAMSLVLFAAMR